MRNLGVAMVGGHGKREKDDFYPTPREAVDALLQAPRLMPQARRRIWEPACGDGAISRVLAEYGHTVISSDLVGRGYGVGGFDFLQAKAAEAPEIITNPPFKLAEAFIRHAMALKVETLALLLKATFWNAASRIALFREHQPAVVAPLTWRLDFTGGGAPTMDCMWVVWGAGWAPCTTRFMPLAKPAPREPEWLQ